MPATQRKQPRSFDDLNTRAWARGEKTNTDELSDELEEFLPGDDDELDRPAASVDINEEDLGKAITAGFGADTDDADEGEPSDADEDQDRKPPPSDARRAPEEDDARYSKRTRKRIERERKLTARERQQRVEVERERDELRDRLAAIEQRQATQDVAAIDGEVQASARELDDLEKRLSKASEDGEHDEVAKITRQMQDASAKKIDAERRKASTSTKVAKKPNGESDQDPGRRAQQMDPRARDLMDANADWWKSDAHREDREVVLAVDRAVAADGFTPNTDDYYIEMVRRARQRGLGDLIQLPTWMSEDDLVDEDVQRRNRKPKGRRPVNRGPGGMGEGGGDRGEMTRLKREASGKVQLTPRDFRRMEQFRLDPKNPKHLQEYARGKAEQARQELSTRG